MNQSQDQHAEALKFNKSKSKDDRHTALLMRMNRHLRTLTEGFRDEAVWSLTDGMGKEAGQLGTLLNFTFMILEGKYSGPQDPQTMLEEEKAELDAEAKPLQVTSDEADVEKKDAEIEAILKLAMQAATDNKQTRCYELGHYLFKMFPARPWSGT
jgi:hypothetical protein